MDSYLLSEILTQLSQNKWQELAKFIAIFVFIWLEVRGLKKEVKKLNITIAESFDKGEKRFENIENQLLKIEHRLTVAEQQLS